jgi:farnesyl diphosphate synthase
MIMCGVTDRKTFDQAREILLIMGEYFQVQDDYLDCYGTPEIIGKIGTDIQDNKCSWLVVQALNQANYEQRRILEENYGKHDAHKVEIIKKLYVEMRLKETFEKYEEESYNQLKTLIGEIKNVPKEVFEFLLNKIYKRSK